MPSLRCKTCGRSVAPSVNLEAGPLCRRCSQDKKDARATIDLIVNVLEAMGCQHVTIDAVAVYVELKKAGMLKDNEVAA